MKNSPTKTMAKTTIEAIKTFLVVQLSDKQGAIPAYQRKQLENPNFETLPAVRQCVEAIEKNPENFLTIIDRMKTSIYGEMFNMLPLEISKKIAAGDPHPFDIEVEFLGTKYLLRPEFDLYTNVYGWSFSGADVYNIAILCNEVDRETGDIIEPFADLTVNLGEFIGLKHTAYMDITNSASLIDAFEEAGLIFQTAYTRQSGFVEFPLYGINAGWLQALNKENYDMYSAAYMMVDDDEEDEQVD